MKAAEPRGPRPRFLIFVSGCALDVRPDGLGPWCPRRTSPLHVPGAPTGPPSERAAIPGITGPDAPPARAGQDTRSQSTAESTAREAYPLADPAAKTRASGHLWMVVAFVHIGGGGLAPRGLPGMNWRHGEPTHREVGTPHRSGSFPDRDRARGDLGVGRGHGPRAGPVGSPRCPIP